jgi:pimeloyl-ACP methyl ester carboxylesterase
VRTLTLIEPVFFSALRYMNRSDAHARLTEEAARFRDTLDDGYPATAINRFINFWCGEGTWERHSAATRMAMLAAVRKVALDWQAAFAFDPGRERLQILSGRTSIFGGDQSPEPMQQLAAALQQLMQDSTQATVRGASHLLPMTHRTELVKLLLEHLHIESGRQLRSA